MFRNILMSLISGISIKKNQIQTRNVSYGKVFENRN